MLACQPHQAPGKHPGRQKALMGCYVALCVRRDAQVRAEGFYTCS